MTAPARPVTVLEDALLSDLSNRAAGTSRRRLNHNLHVPEDPVHRLFNAIEPGSYVRPHRHLHPPKSETVVVVRGSLGLVLFDDDGTVRETVRLDAGGERFGVDLPAGIWHTFVSLMPGTVFFETKSGPYAPIPEIDTAFWMPLEGAPEASQREAEWTKLFESRS